MSIRVPRFGCKDVSLGLFEVAYMSHENDEDLLTFNTFQQNETNGHQKTALEAFLSDETVSRVTIPHVMGGMFDAHFQRMTDRVIKYRNAYGGYVFFRLPATEAELRRQVSE